MLNSNRSHTGCSAKPSLVRGTPRNCARSILSQAQWIQHHSCVCGGTFNRVCVLTCEWPNYTLVAHSECHKTTISLFLCLLCFFQVYTILLQCVDGHFTLQSVLIVCLHIQKPLPFDRLCFTWSTPAMLHKSQQTYSKERIDWYRGVIIGDRGSQQSISRGGKMSSCSADK